MYYIFNRITNAAQNNCLRKILPQKKKSNNGHVYQCFGSIGEFLTLLTAYTVIISIVVVVIDKKKNKFKKTFGLWTIRVLVYLLVN